MGILLCAYVPVCDVYTHPRVSVVVRNPSYPLGPRNSPFKSIKCWNMPVNRRVNMPISKT